MLTSRLLEPMRYSSLRGASELLDLSNGHIVCIYKNSDGPYVFSKLQRHIFSWFTENHRE